MKVVYLVFKESYEGNDYLENIFETGKAAQQYIDSQDRPSEYYITVTEILS